jgi:hypothetical protein
LSKTTLSLSAPKFQCPFVVKITKVDPVENGPLNTSLKNEHFKEVPVCLQTFVKVLFIGRDRVKGVLNRHFSSGSVASENRGGNRKEKRFENKKQSVINFIKKLKGVESHYCRRKTMENVSFRNCSGISSKREPFPYDI